MSGELPFDVRQVLERLPHRHPILLVDRVLDLKPGHSLTAIKNVTINEDFFRGHFPGNPVMPGVLILESLSQAAGLLVSYSIEESRGLLPYLVGVDAVKFRRPVAPGDRLRLEVELIQQRGRYWRFRGAASVDGERTAEAELLVALIRGVEEAR